MSLDPFGRRELLAGSGGLFLCTLAGQRFSPEEEADVEALSREVPVPPKVAAAAAGAGGRRGAARRRPATRASTGSGPSR